LKFRKLASAPPEKRVQFRFNGESVTAPAGDTIAAALLAAGHTTFRRSPASAALRGPYCVMGACFECMVEIAGIGGRQACMTEARDGMEVTSA
jgi:D-hydroxyproline dehydrogenase subunit gamma